MDDVLALIGRESPLLDRDLDEHQAELRETVADGRFLVIGGAGSIGQAVVKEIFARQPAALHVVDLSENNLVELVRDIRSSLGYMAGDFRTFALDCGSALFETFFRAEGPYDYVLNLSALKHVRSEKDPYTLMRMVEVNVLNTVRTLDMAAASGVRRYFSVSTDKAANPVSMMGGTKRVMEMFLLDRADAVPTTTARFANVAFSDGSLLHGFTQRLAKEQPLSAPRDVRRYFLTETEAGQLCLMAALLGRPRENFIPKLDPAENLLTFPEIAERWLRNRGYQPHLCETEEEARGAVGELRKEGRWPCYFFDSDTTGEKPYEEFVAEGETVELERFHALGVITDTPVPDGRRLAEFLRAISALLERGRWTKEEIVELVDGLLPEFAHQETGKYLDDRM